MNESLTEADYQRTYPTHDADLFDQPNQQEN